MEGQLLREGILWKEPGSGQVGGEKKLPKVNHGLGDPGAPWQGLVWWGEDVEAQKAQVTSIGALGQRRQRWASEVPGPPSVPHPA